MAKILKVTNTDWIAVIHRSEGQFSSTTTKKIVKTKKVKLKLTENNASLNSYNLNKIKTFRWSKNRVIHK